MALLADDLLMQSGQRIVGAIMAESGSRLPGVLPVAFQAIAAELSLMLILMARKTFPAKAQERPVHVLHLDLDAGRGWDVLCGVAFLTFQLVVFALQDKARLNGMVEGLPVQTGEVEFLPVMFHMTAAAIRLGSRLLILVRVKPLVRFHSSPNLGMTFQAFQPAGSNSKIVTGSAFGHAL